MSFRLANLEDAHIPPAVEKDLATGEDFLLGALLIVNASDEYAEAGADPAAVAAVALSGAGTESDPFRRPTNREFPPGKMQAIPVQGERKFRSFYVGTLPSEAGGEYGVVRDTDEKWKVDFNETTTTVVKLQSIKPTEEPLNQNEVVVTFLPSVVVEL